MNILITGHLGFVGRSFMRYFKDQHTITGIDLKELRKTISELQSKNLIQTCTIIQHGAKGKLIEGIQCRIAGYTPPAAPGRKAPAAPPQ